MLACDFFHVDCAVTLQRIYVFFVIEINTRYIHILGATATPDGAWTTQQARNLIADIGDRAGKLQFLIRDRAGQFTMSFDAVLSDAGIRVVRIPPRCPQASQRVCRSLVRTIRSEVTDRMLIFGQRHLRRELAEYVSDYNQQRPHRGQGLRPPSPDRPVPIEAPSEIVRRPILGGLINEYHLVA
jgi:putative transposase